MLEPQFQIQLKGESEIFFQIILLLKSPDITLKYVKKKNQGINLLTPPHIFSAFNLCLELTFKTCQTKIKTF